MRLAEKVIRASRLIEKMFLEQGTVADLEVSPIEPEAIVTLGEIESEISGEELQDIVKEIEGRGLKARVLEVEKQGCGFAVQLEDGREITFVFNVADREPVLEIYTDEGRITVSLVPLIGYVDSVPGVVKEIMRDQSIVNEFIGFITDVVGEKGDFEELIEEPVADNEEDAEEKVAEDETTEEELDFSEPEEGDEENVEESKREKIKKVKSLEEQGGNDSGAGIKKVDIPFDKEMKYQRVNVKEGDVAARILKKMTQPNFTAKFMEREGQPDIVSYVTKGDE